MIQIAIGSGKEEKDVGYDENEKVFKLQGEVLYKIPELIQTDKNQVYVVLENSTLGKYYIRIFNLIRFPLDCEEKENELICQYISEKAGEKLKKKNTL